MRLKARRTARLGRARQQPSGVSAIGPSCGAQSGYTTSPQPPPTLRKVAHNHIVDVAIGLIRNSQRLVGVKAFARVQRALASAPYEKQELRTTGLCVCLPQRCVGKHGWCVPRNKHEQLFWFGPKGPAFVIRAVQALLFLTAL